MYCYHHFFYPTISPENITKHEAKALKRDPNDQKIIQGGQTEADTPEAREKLRRSGMTKV
jgi:hypothetical protein